MIAIIAILVLLATPKFLEYTIEAREAKIKHDTRVVSDKVEEYIIGHDDELPDGLTEIDPQLPIDEDRIYDQNGPVDTVEPGPYYNITDSVILDNVNLKNDGEFIVNENGKTYYIHDKKLGSSNDNSNTEEPGDGEDIAMQPKTEAEIDALIAQGWIPISSPMSFQFLPDVSPNSYWPVSPDELDDVLNDEPYLRNFLFGHGTKWEGAYFIPENPKFIQVVDLDLTRDGIDDFYRDTDMGEGLKIDVWGSLSGSYSYEYDGNFNKIFAGDGATEGGKAYFINPVNVTFKNIIFEGFDEMYGSGHSENMPVVWATGSTNCHYENIWINNINADGISAFLDSSWNDADNPDNNTTMKNINFTGNLVGNQIYGAIANQVGIIEDSTVSATIVNSGWNRSVGGFVDVADSIKNCEFNGAITTEEGSAGGLAVSAGIIENSTVNADITASYSAGGLANYATLIANSSFNGNVTSTVNEYTYNSFGAHDSVGGLAAKLGQNEYLDEDNLILRYPEYPAGAGIVNSSASGSLHAFDIAGGLVGTIGSPHDGWPYQELSNAVISSSASMVITTDTESSRAREIAGYSWATGTYHYGEDECSLGYDSEFSPDERTSCDCPYLEIVDSESNSAVY